MSYTRGRQPMASGPDLVCSTFTMRPGNPLREVCAKYYFDESFRGRKQQYYHPLDSHSEKRMLSCEVIPLFDTAGQTYGALVKMTDVTDRFDRTNTLN